MDEYICQLRAAFGPGPLVLAGAGVIAVDDSGRLLLAERVDDGTWGLPGGFTEPGETVEDTARRELREETGLEAGELTLLGVFSGPDAYHRYPNGDQVWNVSVVFITRPEAGGVLRANGDETSRVRFFGREEIPPGLGRPDRPAIRRWLEITGPPGDGESPLR